VQDDAHVDFTITEYAQMRELDEASDAEAPTAGYEPPMRSHRQISPFIPPEIAPDEYYTGCWSKFTG